MDLKCKGNYIGAVREYKKIKQESLAQDANISRSMLSKIENGIEHATSEVISTLFNVLEIDEKEYEVNKKWMYEQLIAISKASIFDNQVIDAIYDKVSQEIDKNIYLSFIFEYKMISLVYYTKKDEYLLKKQMLQELKKYKLYFDKYELALYEDYRSVQASFNGDYELALGILNDINRSNLPEYLNGMIDYHIAFNHHYLKNNFVAIKYFEKSLEYFVKAQNFRKILNVYISLCDLYYKIGNLQLAVDTALNCIDSASNIGVNQQMMGSLYHNISWLYIVTKDYEKAIENATIALQFSPEIHDVQFYLSYSYFCLNEIGQSLCYISKVENIVNDNRIDYRMCIALKKVIQKSDDRIYYLTELYEMINEIYNPVYKQLILEFIIKYYEETEDYKNLAKYSMKLNRVLINKLMILGECDE